MTEIRPHRPAKPPEPDAQTVIDRQPAQSLAAQYRKDAAAHAEAGSWTRAFTELLKALRAAPDASLCAEVLQVARKAGLEVAAAAALEESWADVDPGQRLGFHRALARLWRRQGRLDQARMHLYQLLADHPHDVRAQFELAHLLGREGRYQELCQVLARARRGAAPAGRGP